MKGVPPKDVDSYIQQFPADTQKLLNQMRAIIRKNAPEATEGIGYGMPGYKLNGMLVYFAGYAKHVGFYPGATVALFAQEINGYKTSKGTVQFPLGQPLPVALITKIVKFRVKQNLEKAALKPAPKTKKK